jgi:hypothetical protein
MNIIVASFVFTILAMCAHCNELEKYYHKFDSTDKECKNFLIRAAENLNNDLNSKRIKNIIKDALSPEVSEVNYLLQEERFLSLSISSENESLLGFYCSEKIAGHSPYTSIFRYRNDFISEFTAEEKVPYGEDRMKEGDFQLLFLSSLNISVMELNDAILERGDLDYIAQFKTLRKLGLPARGVQFVEPFSFPAKLETLVVRNTVINENFFNALNRLLSLKELILVDCTIDLPNVMMDHFDLIDKKNTRLIAKPFHGISKNLEKVQVIKSQPRIFDYIVTEKWDLLQSLKIDLYSTVSGFATFVHPTDGETSFPMLKTASISVTDRSAERVAEILEIAKSRYPDIANKVSIVIRSDQK